MFDRAELLTYIFEKSKSTLRGKEIDVLIMAEERIYIIGLSQYVPDPAVQHCHLQKRCQVF